MYNQFPCFFLCFFYRPFQNSDPHSICGSRSRKEYEYGSIRIQIYNPAQCSLCSEVSNLLLLECLAGGERLVVQIVHGGLDSTAAGLHGALKIFVGDATSTEHVAVSKILE